MAVLCNTGRRVERPGVRPAGVFAGFQAPVEVVEAGPGGGGATSTGTWLTQRDGDWSVPSGDASSPWHDGGPQTALNRVPRGGAGDVESGDVAAGDTVIVEHALTVDGLASCGNSRPSAPWDAPLEFKANGGGLFPTNLPTGSYRASYYLDSPYGSTSVGLSESSPVSIVQSASTPRVSFPPNRPAGSSYVLVLTEAGGAAGTGRVFCRDITSPVVEFGRAELWENTFVGGGASEGTNAKPFAAAGLPPSADDTAALIVRPTGRLIFADGSLLTIRGDWAIQSPDGSTADWATFRGSGDFEFNSSRAGDPGRTEYRVIWQGHGKFAWVA